MKPYDVVTKASEQGVLLYLKEGKLAFKATNTKLSDELRKEIAQFKEEIIEILANNSKFAIQLMPYREQRLNGDTIPMSFSQQRLWFIGQLEGESGQYNVSVSYYLNGDFDLKSMESAFVALVKRQQVLSTVYQVDRDQNGFQIIKDVNEFTLSYSDLSTVSEEEALVIIKQELNNEADRPFDISSDIMLRGKIFRLNDSRHVLAVTTHHIASDGWSVGVLTKELFELYQAIIENRTDSLPPLPFQYADYASWQRNLLQGDTLESLLGYWKNRLADIPEVHSLRLDHPRPEESTYAGGRYYQHINIDTAKDLSELARKCNASTFMTLHAAFSAFISNFTGEKDIVIGTPVANRDEEELTGIVGYFANTLVLRAELGDAPYFSQLLKQSRDRLLEAYEHKQIPFEKLVMELRPQRSLQHSPLFQIMLTFHNYEQVNEVESEGLHVEVLDQEALVAKYDLTFDVIENDDGLHITWEYAKDLFELSTIESMANTFAELLKSLIAEPERPIPELSMLSAAEREHLLYDLNDTSVDYAKDQCIHQLFEAQVRKNPDNIALVYEDKQLTYAELDKRANQVAHYLIKQGIKPDSLVVLSLYRSLEMVIGILAILKAGGVYVPLDPDYPQARLDYILEDCKAQVLLTQTSLAPLFADKDMLCVALDELLLDGIDDKAPEINGLTSSNLAYVIYTSGTTGHPKGVMVEHASLVNRIDWMQSEYQLEAQDKVLQKTPFSFDVSVWEFTWPLTSGCCLVLAKPDGHKDPSYLSEVITAHSITLLHFVPSMLNAMLSSGLWSTCTSVKKVFCSGEALPKELTQAFFDTGTQSELHNLYGPTEAAIDVSYLHCKAEYERSIVPIGRGIQNTQLYVLNEHQQLVPFRVMGELYIAGDGVARGYLNKPELTKTQFIDNPFGEGRLYRTGDKVRYLPGGDLAYLGRADHQVKIRGFRIELGEIESTLLKYTNITQATVIATDEPKRLVAYVVSSDCDLSIVEEVTELIDSLRAEVKKSLPDYMVPSAFVVLDSLPITANGKLDRKALPSPDMSAQQGKYIAPSTEIEKQLCDIWQQVLDLDKVGINDNFFEIGGHSLLVMQVIAQAQEAGLFIEVRQLFATSSLGELAQELMSSGNQSKTKFVVPANLIPQGCDNLTCEMLSLVDLNSDELATIVSQVEGGSANIQDIYPLASLQKGILFHHMMNKDHDPYVMPMLFSLPDKTTLGSFIEALSFVVQRHDVLRTSVLWQGLSTPVQVVSRQATPVISWPELDAEQDIETQMQALCSTEKQWMDITKGPLLRMLLAEDNNTGQCFLLLQLHHIISDHIGLDIIQQEGELPTR